MSSGGFLGTLKSKLKRRTTGDKISVDAGSSTTSANAASKISPLPSSSFTRGSRPTAARSPQRTNPFTTPSNDPPPAYSASPAAPVVEGSRPSIDDRYSFLGTFDTIFVIDDSGSMAGRSWRETQAAIAAIAPICTTYDSDGIDIYFLNAKDDPYHHNVTSASTVNEIFSTVRPRGGTPTGQRLHSILKPYLVKCGSNPEAMKPLNIIIVTDGEPTDDVDSVIIQAAKKLDKMDAPAWQVGLQFFQVGNEAGAAEHLKHLDQDLGADIRDMVDTVPWKSSNEGGPPCVLNADGILKVVLGAVHRRLDNSRAKIHG